MGALNWSTEITKHNQKLFILEQQKPQIKNALIHYKLLSGDDLSNAPPMRWILQGVLPEQGFASLYGASGTGKSFLMLDIAAAIAGGESQWCNRRVNQVPVVYACLEGEAGMGKRLNAWSQHNKKPIPDDLQFITQPFDILSNNVADLAKVIVSSGVNNGLVILDTLNRAAPGADENSPIDMGNIISAAQNLQCLIGGLVLLVHHTGKDANKGLRGHSSLYAALDGAIEVTLKNSTREWNVAKSKDDVTGENHPFKLEVISVGIDEYGDEITSCVVRSTESMGNSIKKLPAPKAVNQKIIWSVLKDIINQAECVNGIKSITLGEAIEKTKGKLLVDKSRQTERAQAAISGLVSNGLLNFEDDKLWIP